MNCARCGAPLPLGSSFCRHCREAHDADLRVLARPPVRQGTSDRRCPRCAQPLELWRVELAGPPGALELDRCARCAGLFFDPEELEAVLRDAAIAAPDVDHARLAELHAETKPDPDRKVRYVPCPTCGALMQRQAYGARSGVVADRCGRHGLWLDGGELRRLLHWRRSGGELWEEATQAELASERARAERVRQRSSEAASSWPPAEAPAEDHAWWLVVLRVLAELLGHRVR